MHFKGEPSCLSRRPKFEPTSAARGVQEILEGQRHRLDPFPRHPEALRGSLTTSERKSFTQREEYVTELVNPSPKMGQI